MNATTSTSGYNGGREGYDGKELNIVRGFYGAHGGTANATDLSQRMVRDGDLPIPRLG